MYGHLCNVFTSKYIFLHSSFYIRFKHYSVLQNDDGIGHHLTELQLVATLKSLPLNLYLTHITCTLKIHDLCLVV